MRGDGGCAPNFPSPQPQPRLFHPSRAAPMRLSRSRFSPSDLFADGAAMSTCSTATSAARDGRHRHANCEDAVRGGLERRWRELEREWDAYGPASRRHHRRSRSATGTPSSAVIVAAEPVDAPGSLFLGLCLGGSPGRLVSSVQRTGSSSTASAGVTPERGAKNQIPRRYDGDDHDDAASSVCSVDTGPMAAMAAASSCSCSCAVPGCGCGNRYSSNSSCSSTATSLFSLRDDELAVVGEVAKTGETTWEMGRQGSIGRFVAIAVVGVVLMAAMAAAVLEFAVDDGQAEFLVPT